MKLAIYTLGCKVNQSDSHSIQEMFIQAGWDIVGADTEADVYIINTCVVTDTGQAKSKQAIRQFANERPNSLLVVAGCYPQTAEQEIKEIKGVDLIVGNQNRAQILSLVTEQCKQRQPEQTSLVQSVFDDISFEEMLTGTHTGKTRAFLKIQEGCNQFCSYCIIPYARGRLRSRNLEDIRTQVELLVNQGFREIVLLGIHLGAYGKELASDIGLYDAIQTALSVPTLERLRLGSLECIEVDERLLELIASEPRLAKQLHLPLQSGTDSILQAMNRPYTTAEFKALVDKIRMQVPDIAITTDVIVGFPGESEQDFDTTYEFCERLGFAQMHVFPFSKRKGTPAENIPCQLTKREKRERVAKLTKLKSRMHQEFLSQFIGTKQTVLFENNKADECNGYTSNYIRVYIKSDEYLAKQMLEVKAIKLYKDGLLAELV